MLVSYKAIGRNIRQARNHLGLTQEQTAEKLKISQLHFGRLERGERPASLEQLANIALVLGVTLTSLLEGCVTEPCFVANAEQSEHAFSQATEHLAAGCSPKTRKLMLTLCQAIAEHDKAPDDD